jgi:hypothetical protein
MCGAFSGKNSRRLNQMNKYYIVILHDKDDHEYKTDPVNFPLEEIIEAAEFTISSVPKYVRYSIEKVGS